MRTSKFSEAQIVAILREGEAGVPELQRLKPLEQENARLKRMYADMALENAAIKDVLSRTL